MRRLSLTTRLLSSLAITCLAGSAVAQTASYPSRPVTVIVPFSAGGSVDTAARIVTSKLAERLKQTFIIENAAGAAGTLGTQKVVRAANDGHTLLFAVATPINIAPVISPATVRYDALKDLQPVARVATSTFVLVGKPTLQANDTGALIALARQQPGRLSYGTDGVGGSMHLAAELIKQRAGLDILHVPYRSGPQLLTELAGGQIDLAVMPIALVQPFIKDGKVRAYGVLSAQRTKTLPDVPSLAEHPLLKDIDDRSWYGLLAPAGTDAAIIERLASELAVAVTAPDVAAKLADAGLVPAPLPTAAFADLLQKERKTVSAVVSSAGIKIQ